MTAYQESALAARFARLAPETLEGDWLDVQRRARAHRRRRALTLAIAAALAAVAVGSALGLAPRILDFLSAPPPPPKARSDFVQWLRLERFLGIDSEVVSERPRTVVSHLRDDGNRIFVVAAPTRHGGFCWTEAVRHAFSGGLETPPVRCLGPGDIRRRPLEVGGEFLIDQQSPYRDEFGLMNVTGYIALRQTERLTALYEDGSTDEIPFTWVSEPVAAGFFAFEPDESHLAGPGTRLAEVVALDRDGRRLAGHRVSYSTPETRRWLPPYYGQPQLFPPAADLSRARELHFPALPDTAPRIFVAPAGTDGMCWAHVPATAEVERPAFVTVAERVGRGCERGPGLDRLWTSLGGSLTPANPPLSFIDGIWLFGTVERDVARVELRFADGSRTVTRPRARIVAHVIPEAQWSPGHRLREVVLLDGTGRRVRRFTFPARPHNYPCPREEEFVEGVSYCP